MYKFTLKNSVPDVEKMIDDMIANPLIIIKDERNARKLGRYTRQLRKEKILHISPDRKLQESVAFLKVNNVLQPGTVKKVKGKRTEYFFEHIMLPKNIY